MLGNQVFVSRFFLTSSAGMCACYVLLSVLRDEWSSPAGLFASTAAAAVATVVLAYLRRLIVELGFTLALLVVSAAAIFLAARVPSTLTIATWKTLEPVVCMVWMSFAFRWRLPPLTSACLVGTSAGMAVFTHLPEDVMAPGSMWLVLHSTTGVVAAILLRNLFLEDNSLCRRIHWVHMSLLTCAACAVGGVCVCVFDALVCDPAQDKWYTVGYGDDAVAVKMNGCSRAALYSTSSPFIPGAVCQVLALCSAIMMLRSLDVSKVVVSYSLALVWFYQFLPWLVTSSPSLPLTSLAGGVVGAACGSYLLSRLPSAVPSVAKRPNTLSWVPTPLLACFANLCLRATDENPGGGALLPWGSTAPSTRINTLLDGELGQARTAIDTSDPDGFPADLEFDSGADDSSLLDDDDVSWLQRG